MSIIKIISSEDAKIFIDQEEFGIAKANQILKLDLSKGVYLLELKSQLTGKIYSEDLEVENDISNFIKRINFDTIHLNTNQLLIEGIIESIDSNGIVKSIHG